MISDQDDRIQTVLRLLGYASLDGAKAVLDIGMGNGEIAKAVARRAHGVIGVGLALASYGVDSAWVRENGIAAVESAADCLPFAASSFDVVIMSHVLEHLPNVGWALGEVMRVLVPHGLLCVFV